MRQSNKVGAANGKTTPPSSSASEKRIVSATAESRYREVRADSPTAVQSILCMMAKSVWPLLIASAKDSILP